MEGFTAERREKFSSIQVAMNIPRPRIIKTHLPAFLLPDEFWKVKPKVRKINKF